MTNAGVMVYNGSMAIEESPDFLTTQQAAEELGITRQGVLALVRRNLLTAIRLGQVFAFKRAEIERYKQERKPRGRPRKSGE